MLALVIALILILLILSFVALHYKTVIKRFFIARSKSEDELGSVFDQCEFCQKLEAKEKERLIQHMKIFLHEKRWKMLEPGAVSKKQKAKVALKACLPLTNRQTNYYGLINELYLKPGSSQCFNAQLEEINWFRELYQQYLKEFKHPQLTEDDFIKKSELFFQGNENHRELQSFYKL